MNEGPSDLVRRNRGGVVYAEMVYAPWCDICDDELGEEHNERAAYESLDDHIKENHPEHLENYPK